MLILIIIWHFSREIFLCYSRCYWCRKICGRSDHCDGKTVKQRNQEERRSVSRQGRSPNQNDTLGRRGQFRRIEFGGYTTFITERIFEILVFCKFIELLMYMMTGMSFKMCHLWSCIKTSLALLTNIQFHCCTPVNTSIWPLYSWLYKRHWYSICSLILHLFLLGWKLQCWWCSSFGSQRL